MEKTLYIPESIQAWLNGREPFRNRHLRVSLSVAQGYVVELWSENVWRGAERRWAEAAGTDWREAVDRLADDLAAELAETDSAAADATAASVSAGLLRNLADSLEQEERERRARGEQTD